MNDSHQQPAFVAPEPADLAPLFPGYEIQSLIAVGGMGAVYCALQKSLDRTVALKILPMEFSQDAAFCAGFEAEAKAMARLNHPNLIGVYDFGEVNGMLYIIMEFVAGQSVYHAAYGTAIDPKEVIRLVSGICDGLGHAHENGIIHRDIKPSNILLDLNAQPKIGDFGLARPTNHKAEEGDEIFGTPHYTAPEVVNAPQSVDHRADIFSVGVMLHELLTGKLPANDPRSASMIAHCDPRFDAIIRKATMPVAAARYFSIKDIAKDLQEIVMPLTQKSPVMAPGAPGRVAAPGVPSRTAAPGASRRAAPARRYVQVKKKPSSLPMVLMLLAAAAGAYFYYTKQQVKVVVPTITTTTPAPTKVESTPVAPDPVPEAVAPLIPEQSQDAGMEPVKPEPIVETSDSAPKPVAPKFDVPAFFGRARKIMQDRTRTAIGKYRADLKTNITKYERILKREVRNTNDLSDLNEDKLEKYVETTVAGWLMDDAKIPKQLKKPLSELPDIEERHAEAVQIQTAIIDAFYVELTKESATYILGLEKQIERLKEENDTGAISLIEEEIEKTKNDPKHFPDLMMESDAARAGLE